MVLFHTQVAGRDGWRRMDHDGKKEDGSSRIASTLSTHAIFLDLLDVDVHLHCIECGNWVMDHTTNRTLGLPLLLTPARPNGGWQSIRMHTLIPHFSTSTCRWVEATLGGLDAEASTVSDASPSEKDLSKKERDTLTTTTSQCHQNKGNISSQRTQLPHTVHLGREPTNGTHGIQESNSTEDFEVCAPQESLIAVRTACVKNFQITRRGDSCPVCALARGFNRSNHRVVFAKVAPSMLAFKAKTGKVVRVVSVSSEADDPQGEHVLSRASFSLVLVYRYEQRQNIRHPGTGVREQRSHWDLVACG